MANRYRYSRSPDQPYAVDLHPLPAAEASALIHKAFTAFRKLFAAIQIAKHDDSDVARVASVSGDDGDNHQHSSSKSVMVCTSGLVYGTLEEVAALYVHDDSRMVLDFPDSKRLYTLAEPSKASPMRCAGVRWSRWKSTSKLVSDRDMIYVEYMDTFTDPVAGRRGWARCTKSIVHPVCPESQHPDGPVRAQLHCSGIIMHETDTYGELEATLLVHMDTQGMPAFVAQKALNSRKKSLQHINHVLKLTRQMSGTPQSDDDMVLGGGSLTGDERACRSCNEHVSKWTRVRHCRYCDATLCKPCALISYNQAADKEENPKTTRMCVDCGTGKKPRPVNGTGIAEDRPLSPSALAALSLQRPHVYSKGRVNSSRSIDTESSVGSAREDTDELRHQRLRHASSVSSTSTTAQASQPGLQRMNSRQRGASNSSDMGSFRLAPAVKMDLSYLNDIVSAKPKASSNTESQ
uniref:FYVE-type domain-containing protein n=1 Tax=Globisporangium ultimum (strain ATCC 200006 / CBS 805.95 / DAOM BR144) TaxID=431595 RepID=K3W5B5_GLOUD